MKIIVLISFGLLLSSCSTVDYYYANYDKKLETESRFARDKGQCELAFGAPLMTVRGVNVEGSSWYSCMQTKGWYIAKKNER
jgi:hypothetical protein